MDLNELWHTKDERPNCSCDILMYDSGWAAVGRYQKEHDLVSVDEAPDGDSWEWNDMQYDYWCYIDDIKPQIK